MKEEDKLKVSTILLFMTIILYIIGILTGFSSATAFYSNFTYNDSSYFLNDSLTSASFSVYNQLFLNFDGTDYITIQNSEVGEGLSEFSVCGWFYFNSTVNSDNQFQGLYSDRYNTNDTNWFLALVRPEGYFQTLIKDSSSEEKTLQTGETLSTNEWMYLCSYYDDNYLYTSINGFINTKATKTKTIAPNGFSARIGTYYDAGVIRGFNGSLKEFKIFNSTLTEEEQFLLINGYNYVHTEEITDMTEFAGANFTNTKIINNGAIDEWDYHIREIGNTIKIGNEYILVYTGYNTSSPTYGTTFIGWANSTDKVTWTKQGKIGLSLSSEDPYLINNGTNLFLYTEDKSVSTFRNITLWVFDGLSLEDSSTLYYPLDKGSVGEFDAEDVSSPVVVFDNSTYYMWYEGRNSTQSGMIGLATSSDGITWTKHPDNPFIQGVKHQFDKVSNVPDDIYLENGIYYFIYHTYSAGDESSGFWNIQLSTFSNITDKSDYTRFSNYPMVKELSTLMFMNFDGDYSSYGVVGDDIKLFTLTNREKIYSSFSDDNLVLQYNLNENNGTTTYDSSGNSNDGTITGATWNNDGVLNTLTSAVDYVFNFTTGFLEILNPSYYFSSLFFSSGFCTPTYVNSSWSDWINGSCKSNNLSLNYRILISFDENSCGGDNIEYRENSYSACVYESRNETYFIDFDKSINRWLLFASFIVSIALLFFKKYKLSSVILFADFAIMFFSNINWIFIGMVLFASIKIAGLGNK